MNPEALAAKIRSIGREISPDSLNATKELYAPLHQIAPFTGVTVHRDMAYGNHERQRLDVFTPGVTGGPFRPVLIFIHGGGFVRGNKHTPDTPFYDHVGVWAVRHNLCGININHRLAPEYKWPAVIHDIAAAVDWIRQHGQDYGIDATRLFLMGQSAGAAHAASYLAHPEFYAPAEHGISGAILISGIYNLEILEPDELTRTYFGDDPSHYSERSAIQGLQAATVPVLVAAAGYDPAFFERQTLELLTTLFERDRKLPMFVHMFGHNHLSGILHLGLEGDRLGAAILHLVNDA